MPMRYLKAGGAHMSDRMDTWVYVFLATTILLGAMLWQFGSGGVLAHVFTVSALLLGIFVMMISQRGIVHPDSIADDEIVPVANPFDQEPVVAAAPVRDGPYDPRLRTPRPFDTLSDDAIRPAEPVTRPPIVRSPITQAPAIPEPLRAPVAEPVVEPVITPRPVAVEPIVPAPVSPPISTGRKFIITPDTPPPAA